MVVLVENGKSGSVSAAPIFREVAQGVMALTQGEQTLPDGQEREEYW